MLFLSALALTFPSLFEEPRAAAPEPSATARVVVVGASMSAGLGVSPDGRERSLLEAGVPLADVLAAASVREGATFQTFHNGFFFTSPMKTGPKLLDQALARDPTLVVALDFLFWFGYGATDREGQAIKSEDQRLQLLEEGLVLLERVECPLVIGDFPDMSPAVGKMIAPAQMPELETLAALNETLRGWAEARSNVVLVSLSEAVTKMRSNEPFTLAGREWPAGSAATLMQRDDLHPTLEGVVAVIEIMVHELAEHEVVRAQDFRLDVAAIKQRLAEQAAARAAEKARAKEERAGAGK